MASIKNVALWGVGGENIGNFLVKALIQDGSFNLTVLARQSSKASYPNGLKVIRIDDDLSHASLVEALKGQDAVVSAVSMPGEASQYALVKAAVEAGVGRFVPSEYGFDNADPKNVALNPIFKGKNEFVKFIDPIAKENPSFTWTSLATGLWLDWGLATKFAEIDTQAHSVTYWADGSHKPSFSTLPYAARGVVEILKHPDLFQNQRVFMQAFAASQREIVAELEKQQGVTYQTKATDGPALMKQWADVLAKGFDLPTVYKTVIGEIWLPEYKADFVEAGKSPILEHFVKMPKITLQDVIKEHVASL